MGADETIIRRILTVNHAGEHGAISIYSAQIARTGRFPELKSWLEQTLAHERSHRAAFLASMADRGAKPCCTMSLWSRGGWLLGWMCALLGPRGVLACTAAVERTVHRHLEEQIRFLATRDPDLATLIRAIQKEELQHLAFAEGRLAGRSLPRLALESLVSACTEAVIFLSTRGASLHLTRAMRALPG
jgi:ubiquinone biosynthesis monooxygenase Coq7